MRSAKVIIAVALVLMLLCGTAAGETWRAAEEDLPMFDTLLERLETEEKDKVKADQEELDYILEMIHLKSADEYEVGRAIVDHWHKSVRNCNYRRFAYRGEETAMPLERSGLDFSGKHAFVVLGYQLKDGEMTSELMGRCDAAAAAARAFPDSLVICTGGATGMNNLEGRTEAGEMKKYLAKNCHIDADRILTDTQAMTTLENAENVFQILKQEGIQKITLVTSDYHQMWAQVLFNAVAAVWKVRTGYEVTFVGNYNLIVQPESAKSAASGLGQVRNLLRDGITVEP
ncbi:MAG: YdcF family protein [Clostridia bacterium]|nr:YdcF family protein [Clostridia bacterium]